MNEYLDMISQQIGIPIWFLMIILTWTIIWKLLGLWNSARRDNIFWFITIALFNTVGILEILYIFVFSKMKFIKATRKIKKKKKKR